MSLGFFIVFSVVEGGSLEMASHINYTEPTFSEAHSRRHLPDHLAVHYRQLVSCAVTRQLLDPSIDNECAHIDKDRDIFAEWEINDRVVARASVRKEVLRLGIPWAKFCLDVENAQQESHVLSPVYYENDQKFESGVTMTTKVKRDVHDEKLDRYSHTGKTQGEVRTTGTDVMKLSLEFQMQNLRHFSELRRWGNNNDTREND